MPVVTASSGTKKSDIEAADRVYIPYGACDELIKAKDDYVLLSGPAGSGKTISACWKIFMCAEKYPGARILICRKTRESMTQSVLVTWEEKVVPAGHPCLVGPQRNERKEYRFPNGSRVVIAGLRQSSRDNSQQVMSTDYDMCFVGDTEVSSPTTIERGFDRVYSGKLVTITTSSGNKLTGTPNHPILTPRGWVGLGRLRKGDNVISRLPIIPVLSAVDPNVANKPSPIAEVVSDLAKVFRVNDVERIPTVPASFHGDGVYGYVDVVTPKCSHSFPVSLKPSPCLGGKVKSPVWIVLDCIADVSIIDDGISRHVYNLQTEASWYYAGNLVAHNCYIPEAIELTEDEFEKLTTRLRHGVMPYQQAIADTNPSSPTHWLKKRCDAGLCRIIHSDHTDNPTLWDRKNECWTPFGAKYIAKLDMLTGARKQRLRYGKWVQAEGVIYENWNEATNVVDSFPIPKEWRRFITIDFGFNEPFVAAWFALDNDDHLYLYREYVKTKTLVEDHADAIAAYCADEPWPEAIICDHDAEGRATLEKHLGRSTTAAKKEILAGIQFVESRLAVQGDGKPRFMIFRDALLFKDTNMDEDKKPIGLIEEMPEYVWLKTNPDKPKEQPMDKNNHSCDVLRYMCVHLESGTWVPPGTIVDKKESSPAQDWRSKKTSNWRNKSGINWRLMDEV